MADITFACPECKESLSVEESYAGQEGECPHCGKGIVIPTVPATGEHHSKPGECPFCGGQIPTAALRCKNCGKNLLQGGSPTEAHPHHQVETGQADNSNPLNPILNAGGLIGALIGALIPIGALYLSGVPLSDTIGRPVALCLVVGALSGNYVWGLRVNKTARGALAIILGLAIRLIAGFAVGFVAWGLISRFTGGEERQKREGARRALIELGEMATPEAISNLVQKMDGGDEVKRIRKAAERGDAEAQNTLGSMYSDGNVVTQDDAEAVKWFRKAAAQGYPMAQNNLGAMYDNGRGVPMDNVTAVEWYRKAANQGYASAQFNLGMMYDNGEGVSKNTTTANRWLRKAAEQGHAGAQESLDYEGSK